MTSSERIIAFGIAGSLAISTPFVTAFCIGDFIRDKTVNNTPKQQIAWSLLKGPVIIWSIFLLLAAGLLAASSTPLGVYVALYCLANLASNILTTIYLISQHISRL